MEMLTIRINILI